MSLSLSSSRRQCVAFLASLAFPAFALDKPAGPVVLTISGALTQANDGGQAQFDMQMLQALPQQSFTTQIRWYPDPVNFTGPLMRDVLAAAGAKGSKITAAALNDYQTDIPFEDVLKYDVILARLVNGKPMTVRERGPLFIVYPYDTKAELRSELYYSRSVWQLRSLSVR